MTVDQLYQEHKLTLTACDLGKTVVFEMVLQACRTVQHSAAQGVLHSTVLLYPNTEGRPCEPPQYKYCDCPAGADHCRCRLSCTCPSGPGLRLLFTCGNFIFCDISILMLVNKRQCVVRFREPLPSQAPS